jgi:alkanesulfonate monooxygenase SsuD/methylene tetrahydromethanopterin reductase-like flavin-dependent oxidoreductase (luciferase family)
MRRSSMARTELELIKHYDPNFTIRELGRQLVISSNTWLVIGTAEQVTNQLSELYEAGAVDGYNLMFPFLPVDFDRFTEQVVPLLQARGVFRSDYAPGTLRDRLK